MCSFINKELSICASIYIDDTIIVSPAELIEDALSLVTFFYQAVRIPIQNEKVETLLPTPESLAPTDVFRVLGLQYKIISDPLQLHVQLPGVKKETLLQEIKLAQDLILSKSLQLQMMQSITGQATHALFFRRHSVAFAKMRPLFVASDERRFANVMKQKQFRVLLVETLKSIANTIERAKPVKFTSSTEKKKLALGYTDASLEPQPDGSSTAQIGGLFFLSGTHTESTDLIRFPFSYKIKNATYDIAVYEAMAILVALDRFPRNMRNKFQLAIGVDNTSTLFAIAKAMTKNQQLAAATSLVIEAFCDSTLLFYVPSKENIADILTRDERETELDDRLFIEAIRTDPTDVNKFQHQIDKRASEIRRFFVDDNAKRRKKNKN